MELSGAESGIKINNRKSYYHKLRMNFVFQKIVLKDEAISMGYITRRVIDGSPYQVSKPAGPGDHTTGYNWCGASSPFILISYMFTIRPSLTLSVYILSHFIVV